MKKFIIIFYSRQKVNCLAVSLDDSTLASGSDDLTVRIWDTISRQCVKILKSKDYLAFIKLDDYWVGNSFAQNCSI